LNLLLLQNKITTNRAMILLSPDFLNYF